MTIIQIEWESIMKSLRRIIVAMFVMAMVSTTAMAAVNDYPTVRWEEITYLDYSGEEQSMSIKITGVVGTPIIEGSTVDLAVPEITVCGGWSYFTQNDDGTFVTTYGDGANIESGVNYTKEELISLLPTSDVEIITVVDGAEMTLTSVKNPDRSEEFFPGGYYFIDRERTIMMVGEGQFGNYGTYAPATLGLRDDAIGGWHEQLWLLTSHSKR